MKVITFAEDNPAAGTWFALLWVSFTQARPGSRPLATLALERDVLQKLLAISEPAEANGRALREPCTVAVTDPERALLAAYLPAAGFQPALSATVLDLLAHLADVPTGGE